MNETDRRVKRTHKILVDALIAESLEKGYDQVTIRDITDRADIAYSTFFRHYRDKDELLLAMLGSVLETMRDLILQNPDASAESAGRILFAHIQEHARFYRVLFNGHGTSAVLWRFQQMVEADVLKIYASRITTANAGILLELVVHHLIAAIIAMVTWWLAHDMPYPVEQMARYYSELVATPVERQLGLYQPEA